MQSLGNTLLTAIPNAMVVMEVGQVLHCNFWGRMEQSFTRITHTFQLILGFQENVVKKVKPEQL